MDHGLLVPPRASESIMGTESAQIGDRVSFRISDVYLPEPSEVLARLTPELEANGVVVEFSDSGSSPQAYAVVRLTAEQSVLLPVTALRVVR
jgi:fructoselysine-6-P-deglycase FrlB-like protein